MISTHICEKLRVIKRPKMNICIAKRHLYNISNMALTIIS